MKLWDRGKGVAGEWVTVTWSDHHEGCKSCRVVDLERPATLASSCPMGAQLIAEEMKKRQAPVAKKKTEEVKAWAKDHPEAFVVEKASAEYVKKITRYVGDK